MEWRRLGGVARGVVTVMRELGVVLLQEAPYSGGYFSELMAALHLLGHVLQILKEIQTFAIFDRF